MDSGDRRVVAFGIGLAGVILVGTGAAILFQHAELGARSLEPASRLVMLDDGNTHPTDEPLVTTAARPDAEHGAGAVAAGVGVSMLMLGWTVVVVAFLVPGGRDELGSTRYTARRVARR